MVKERQHDALQTIFSFFLGLMVVAFIGVGVNTFYPSPDLNQNTQMQTLSNQQMRIENRRASNGSLTPADQAEYDRLQVKMDALNKRSQTIGETWARNTSIVLILFATTVMAISLIRSEQLKVISNGLLLGGLFTMVYGSGWTIASGDSKARFFVITFALAVTIGLGYLKFVRGRTEEPADVEAPPASAS
jgi:hypothetical protein